MLASTHAQAWLGNRLGRPGRSVFVLKFFRSSREMVYPREEAGTIHTWPRKEAFVTTCKERPC